MEEKELPHAPPEDASGSLAELRRSVRDASIELRGSPNPQIEDELREALEAIEEEQDHMREMLESTHGYAPLELLDQVADLKEENDQLRETMLSKHGGEPLALLDELDEAREENERLREALQSIYDLTAHSVVNKTSSAHGFAERALRIRDANEKSPTSD